MNAITCSRLFTLKNVASLRLPLVNASHLSTSQVNQNESMPDKLYKKIIVEVRGHEPAVLRSYQTFVSLAAEELNVQIAKIWEPKKVLERRTLLKSVFVNKKHMVQYEMRTHFKVFELKHLTGSTADTFLEYLQRNVPEGVAMKVTKHSIEPLDDYFKTAPQSTEVTAES